MTDQNNTTKDTTNEYKAIVADLAKCDPLYELFGNDVCMFCDGMNKHLPNCPYRRAVELTQQPDEITPEALEALGFDLDTKPEYFEWNHSLTKFRKTFPEPIDWFINVELMPSSLLEKIYVSVWLVLEKSAWRLPIKTLSDLRDLVRLLDVKS